MKGKILIVDDEPNLLRMLEFTLQAEGYTTILARNGQEALHKSQTEQPDLMILDVMLPDMSGLEICQHLRSVAETQALPVIMLSARGQVTYKIAGLEAGADEYVTKPVDTDELVARIAALLARTRRLRQVQPARAGKVLGFIGAKGGTGTTTVALNVAVTLARREKTVTAVELRSYYGTFSTQLGGAPLNNLSNLLQLNPTQLTEQALNMHLANHPSGLRLLYGPQKVEQYQNIAYDQAQAIIKGLAGQAEYTIIDLPACPAEASQAALLLCNFVALVVELGPSGLKSGRLMLDLMKSWGLNQGVVGAVVVNQRSLKIDLAGVRAQLGCELVGIVPPAAEACTVAQVRGVPLVLYQPESVAAIQLGEIASRLSAEKIMAMPI